jgi:hypothetical protein
MAVAEISRDFPAALLPSNFLFMVTLLLHVD